MKSNKKSIGDLKETPVEGPPRAESSACKMDWKSSFAIPGSETKKERGGNDTILHEKQRIAGRRSKVALVPADANKSNSGGETILQEKERIARRRSKVALVPADANKSNSGEETILQEKERIAGRRSINEAELGVASSEEPPDRVSNPIEEPSEAAPDSYPGAVRGYGPGRSSSDVSVDSDVGFTVRTESATPSQPVDTICIGSNGVRPCAIVEYVAIAISGDDSCYESQEYYQHAMEYDPDVEPPLHKNRRFRFYAIITTLVIVLVGAAVGVTIPLLFSKDNGENSPTFAPTDAPTTTAEGIYRDQFIAVVGPQVNVDDSAHDRAAHWIMYEDRQRLSPLSESLIQRYILVLFYFKTTDNEATPWKSCNRPRFNEDASCDFQHFTRSALDDSIIFQPEKATRWLSNTHECDWVGVNCDEGAIVVALDIWGQNLAGPLPGELSHITFLQSISLGYNDFTGTLPIEFAEMRHLVNLEVNGNQLDGSIPPEFWKTLTLQNFNVVENTITGTLSTEVGFLTNLKGLHLSNNLLQGTLPTEIGNLQFLSYVRADGNQLSGSIPTQLGSLRFLEELWLHENLLSGTIPTEFGLLAEIGELRLFRNRIYGTIPDQLWDNKTQLKRLDLQDMLLSGTLSTRIGDLQKLEIIRLRRNRLTGTIPTEIAKLRSLRLAWFHLNQFSGSVPLQLCSRVGPGFLEFLNADCGPDGAPSQECECCNGCCDRDTELCQLTDDNYN